MSVRADAETLRQIPIFRDCEPVHLQLLAFASERQQFVKGEALIKQGRKAQSAYLILSGDVDLQIDTPKGPETVGRGQPGALIGEVAMIGATQYSITAIARESVATARIDQSLFNRVASEYPEFGRTVFRVLAERLHGSMLELDDVRNLINRGRGYTRS
jgi:CRP/FNR family transcriptional regulator, cyclic AMP receptor protein